MDFTPETMNTAQMFLGTSTAPGGAVMPRGVNLENVAAYARTPAGRNLAKAVMGRVQQQRRR